MSVLRVRGHALPNGEFLDLYADGDRWTTDPVPGAELAGEGWLSADRATSPFSPEITQRKPVWDEPVSGGVPRRALGR